MTYKAPIQDLRHFCQDVIDINEIQSMPIFEDMSGELFEAIIEEAAKFGENELLPLNHLGDAQGAKFIDGVVSTPKGWTQAYEKFIESGWNGLPASMEYGGQGMPLLFSAAVQEIWHASNMSFALCPLLTQGAVEAVSEHASDALKAEFLEKMISGKWTGTMNLTEPHAGSDLGIIRTKADRAEGHYLISGQKIFITYGDHDMTDNIVHLVLARTPDAPKGVKGISLFIVPKYLADETGAYTVDNHIKTIGIEEKLGIHASPTCALSYENATGYLVGEENKGLMYMFTMMNNARHSVAVQANGLSDRAYQHALAYAKNRVQGQIENKAVSIIHHPDVKRILLKQKARIEAVRALGLYTALAMDIANNHQDNAKATLYSHIVDIMIPVLKSSATEWGVENVSLALQVFGGMGYVEETGAAQFYRDQRITSIYEGTTGIQSLDLIGRKLLRDKGEQSSHVLSHIKQDIDAMSGENMATIKQQLTQSTVLLEEAINHILDFENPEQAFAVADAYWRLWAVVVCGWMLAKSAHASHAKLTSENTENTAFYKAKLHTVDYYFSQEFGLCGYYLETIKSAGKGVCEVDLTS